MKKIKLLFIVLVVLVVAGCRSYDYAKLEEEMGEKAATYYEEYIKGFVGGINQHKITLAAMDNTGVDIDTFVEKECDLEESFSLIKVTLNEEGFPEDEYTVVNHLTCKDYETE